MTKDELIEELGNLAIRFSEGWHEGIKIDASDIMLFNQIAEALAQEQEPVAWLITDEKINSLQVDSIQRLVDRARHAHMTDIKLRINGQDEWHQADWLKHLTRTTPPQRSEPSGNPSAWVGLTDEEIAQGCKESWVAEQAFQSAVWWAEEKLKEKNT